MALEKKIEKAVKLGIELPEGATEAQVDELIDQKQKIIQQGKDEDRIRKAAEKKAADDALKNKVVLKDVDGDDVDQADYFFPRTEEEKILDSQGKVLKTLAPTDQTAPASFNKFCGYPVDREELIEAFVKVFPRSKGFLFYKARDKEVYTVIVPLKYAKTVSRSNESRPGDMQRHAMSFLQEGSVNVDSLKRKLEMIAAHKDSISTEPIAL